VHKAKCSSSRGHISLIFIVRFCALNFPVLRSARRDSTLRAKMDLRSILTYLSIKDMNAREIYTDMNDTLGADCIGYSTITKYLREKNSWTRCMTGISSRKLNKKISMMKQFLGLLRNAPFCSLRQIGRRTLIPTRMVQYRLLASLEYRIRNIRWVLHSLIASQKQSRIEISQDLLQVLRLVNNHAWKYIVTLDEA
jgi:hypothetical protein